MKISNSLENRSREESLQTYRIVPVKGASPHKGALYGLRKVQTDKSYHNCPKILNNCPIFNPKPPLESSEAQHLGHQVRSGLASALCALIRVNTVPYFRESPAKVDPHLGNFSS